jgi:serine/threonine-protein kinase
LPGVDLRTDIYSLGLIIFEMLTGRPCFTGATPSLLIAKQVAEPPPPMTPTREPLPHTLRSGVMRMLAKKPDDRPQSMDEVLKIIGQDAALAHAAPTERATPAPAAPPPGTLIAPVAEPTKPETNRGTANMRPDPLMRLPPPRSKAPLLIGMGLVTFALVVGAVISLRKPPPAAPADTPVEATPPAAPVEPPPAPPPAPAPTVAKPAPEPVAAPVPPPAKKKPFAKKTTGPSTLKDVYSDDPPLKEIP